MNISSTRRVLLGAVAALGVASMTPAQAQGYPNKPIQLIVPYSPGGPTDVVARLMAQRLGERLGQSVVVMSMPGAGGVIGTDFVARSKPDGYTILFAVNSMAIFPFTRRPDNPLPFDPLAFAPIGRVADSAHVIVANKATGFHSLADMVAAAKKKPDSVSYGSAGVGGTTHLPLAIFAHEAGISLTHVPYKGAAPAMSDTMAGMVSMSGPGYSSSVKDAIDQGMLLPLAVTSAQRLPFLPNVPTMAEQGYPDMVFPIWYALFAAKGTPPEIVDKIDNELKEMAKEPAYRKALYAQGNVPVYSTPDQLGKLLKDDIAKLGARLKAADINIQE